MNIGNIKITLQLHITGVILGSAYNCPSAKRGSTALKSYFKFAELTFRVNVSIPSVCEVAPENKYIGRESKCFLFGNI